MRVVLVGFACAAVLVFLFRFVTRTLLSAPPPSPPPVAAAPADPVIALQPLILDVLQRFDDAATMRLVAFEVAVQQGLTMVAMPALLRTALEAAVSGAIDRAIAGFVLVTAERRDGNIEIAVLDDGRATDAAAVEAALQPVRQALAMHGGSLEVIGQPGTGTTVVLRLPQPPDGPGPRPWVRQRPFPAEAHADPPP